MLILWIKKIKTGGQNSQPKNARESLQKHNEDMRRFQLCHPKLKSLQTQDIMIAGGHVLAAVHSVKMTQYAKN